MTVGQAERVANLSEIRAHVAAVRAAVANAGLSDVRAAIDGTVVVHSDRPRLLDLGLITSQLGQIVGHPVRVFFDSTPVVQSWDLAPL